MGHRYSGGPGGGRCGCRRRLGTPCARPPAATPCMMMMMSGERCVVGIFGGGGGGLQGERGSA